MKAFSAKRVSHESTQLNIAMPEIVFPLLCPVREADWVPGWKYRMIYSRSGVAELGCVFVTPEEDGSEITWVVTEYDPALFRIGFVWIHPALVTAQINIALSRQEPEHTLASIRYTYTALSPIGNRIVEGYDKVWFEYKMKHWEAAINHYLRTGTLIEANSRE